MSKTAIKNYAIWARVQLIEAVKQRAYEYEITADGVNDGELEAIGGKPLSIEEINQRRRLVAQIDQKGYEQVMEEAAYTWFNRFIALRFMEVNGYLPSKIRVFTDENGAFKPEILSEAMTVELDGLNREVVFDLLDRQDNEALYKYLLITQCNALHEGLPYMFEKIANWTELLFPANLLRADSVIARMVADIPEPDWTDQVQIIGWLYQYYNSELKDDTFALLKKNVKITKERIPSATQLFTPDWIVRYMVENSLGRLWCEGHGDFDKSQWKYYLDEAEQEPEVQAQLETIRAEYRGLNPQDIKLIDPCMGSGHILVYAFDVLMQLYAAAGWNERDAAQSILEHNLYGLDIDDRAAQLAYFAVMMKARQYDRRLFSRGIQPNVYAIRESNGIQAMTIEYFHQGNPKLKADIERIVTEMQDAKEYGSILNITPVDFAGLYARFDEIREDINMMQMSALDELLPLVRCAELLAQKYDVVVTNPPYMGASGMNARLTEYLKEAFFNENADLYSCFIKHGTQMIKTHGFSCMVTMQSWMFLPTFEKMRSDLLHNHTLTNLMHMDNMVMGIAFGTAVSIFVKHHFDGFRGTFNEVRYKDIDGGKPISFPVHNNRYAQIGTDCFSTIPGNPIAYWVSEKEFDAFRMSEKWDKYVRGKVGLQTGDNEKFLRMWYEVKICDISFKTNSCAETEINNVKWYPYNKAGEYNKWYGNRVYVVNWEQNGFLIRNNYGENGKPRSRPQNMDSYFERCISWSDITSGDISFRLFESGFISDASANLLLFNSSEVENYILGLLNTKMVLKWSKILNPTIHFKVGDLFKLPLIVKLSSQIDDLVSENTLLSQMDWDSLEASWDFKRNPLV